MLLIITCGINLKGHAIKKMKHNGSIYNMTFQNFIQENRTLRITILGFGTPDGIWILGLCDSCRRATFANPEES